MYTLVTLALLSITAAAGYYSRTNLKKFQLLMGTQALMASLIAAHQMMTNGPMIRIVCLTIVALIGLKSLFLP